MAKEETNKPWNKKEWLEDKRKRAEEEKKAKETK